jgi:hypothetical protein
MAILDGGGSGLGTYCEGKITSEQVKDYAERKGITEEMAEKWLQPNLAE